MKIALVHDHLVQNGGAEQVLKALKEIFPQAPVFSLVANKKIVRQTVDCPVQTSFLQKMPLGLKKYQWYLPLMPAAIESLDLMDYDIVISSASSFAKGVIVKPGAIHICYCHTPTRYLWSDAHSYIKELGVPSPAKGILPYLTQRLRIWDTLAANRVDNFISNSQNIKEKIKRYYSRESEVIYPPVYTDKFFILPGEKKYFLAGSRLVPYKKIDIAVRAFSRLGVPLKVFGTGPELKRLKQIAKPNVEFLGEVSSAEKSILFANSIAYINPQDEDFGITALEAMASGRPVIAFRQGGAVESVIEGVTGEFFDEQSWEELADKIIRFDRWKYDPYAIREHAKKFDVSIFKQRVLEFINKKTALPGRNA